MIIYSTSKGKVLYDVELTYQVASLDVWENYVLVGSCPVQIFRLEEKRLQRIIVIDPEDDLTIEVYIMIISGLIELRNKITLLYKILPI